MLAGFSANSHISLNEGRLPSRFIGNKCCPFLMRCASSTPARVTAADRNDLSPSIEAHRCLMARWSCSTTLLRYRRARTSTCRQRGSSLPSDSKPRRVALLPSMLIFLGHGTRPSATAARKHACADSLLRSLQSRDPMDFPFLSTARNR